MSKYHFTLSKEFFASNFFSLLVGFVFFINVSIVPESKTVLQEKTLIDFESFSVSDMKISVKSNSGLGPEPKLSEFFTSPDLESAKSLLFRLPRGATSELWEIRFASPLLFDGYIYTIDFPIYSNNSAGEIVALFQDANFEIRKISIAKISKKGWETYSIKILNKIPQMDASPNIPSKVYLIGFLYYPPKIESKDREDILAIDDIQYKSIPKLKNLPETKN
ncbi:MAG: hypothetical protein SFU98_14795 [Leptospiraceae bacterium]|nr:hypothetical protein [Leptospiraceae bacterium]